MIALITGANRGIGFATAKGLLVHGHTVIITARSEAKGQNARDALQHFGDAHFISMDVTDESSVQAAATQLQAQFGQLDALINNAAINYDTHQHMANADLVEVETTLGTNLIGAWRCIQMFLPLLRKSPAARIVNVSSGSGSLASQTGGTPAYAISKLALNGLTLGFAQQLHSDKILVNAVCPGWVRTDMGGSGAPRSPEQGASGIIWAATLPKNGPTGKFFRDGKEIAW